MKKVSLYTPLVLPKRSIVTLGIKSREIRRKSVGLITLLPLDGTGFNPSPEQTKQFPSTRVSGFGHRKQEVQESCLCGQKGQLRSTTMKTLIPRANFVSLKCFLNSSWFEFYTAVSEQNSMPHYLFLCQMNILFLKCLRQAIGHSFYACLISCSRAK